MFRKVLLPSPQEREHNLKLYSATLLDWMLSPPCSLNRRCFWLADILRWTFRWAGDCIELLLRSLPGRDLWLRVLLDRVSLPSHCKDKKQIWKPSSSLSLLKTYTISLLSLFKSRSTSKVTLKQHLLPNDLNCGWRLQIFFPNKISLLLIIVNYNLKKNFYMMMHCWHLAPDKLYMGAYVGNVNNLKVLFIIFCGNAES